MNIEIFDSYADMCRITAKEILADLKDNPRQLLCIAAGHTSLGLFRELVQAYKEGRADFSKASFVAMDEWLYMSPDTKDSCGCFLMEHFLNHVNYHPQNVRLWDASKKDMATECNEIETFIKDHSCNRCIDFLILGAGMNGHLALNEPGSDLYGRAHVSSLDPITQKVGQKYFEGDAVLQGGATLGIQNFREAKRCILMINDSHKAGILYQIMQANQSDPAIPATAILEFENASLYCDRTAASKWTAH